MIDLAKRDVLLSIAPRVAELITRHEFAKGKHEWLPSQILSPLFPSMKGNLSWSAGMDQLRALVQKAQMIPHALRAAFVLNLLTEEDLPHFVSLIFFHVGDDDVYAAWANRWAMEEQMHGSALYVYALQTDLVNREWLEQLRQAYVLNGFWPGWKRNPYRLVAYATLQEMATQVSHQNLGKLVEPVEGLLGKLFRHIAGDEARHHIFYRDLFGLILKEDPSAAVAALSDVVYPFVMPGATIPQYQDFFDIQSKLQIFTPLDYERIVRTLSRFWKLETLTGLTPSAEVAREKILALPDRIHRVGERAQGQKNKKEYRFPFFDESVVV